ncbi:MAG: hypothetical protein A2Z72_02230 [Omnitrophica bacterium RBG_13_46_9]|nr:MAG: hypothetical protein A2Z72_02230 [Omnitrophica bacterium RBG_13_46_9]
MTRVTFGTFLRKLRLTKGYGLRKFAEKIKWLPSNLSHTESGRINPPCDLKVLKNIAKALELKENSEDWNKLFDLAAEAPGRIPADIADYVSDHELAPMMLRTVANKKLTKAQIKKLINDIKKM